MGTDEDDWTVTDALRMAACNAATLLHPEWEYGAAHVVLSDFNTDDESIGYALTRVSAESLRRFLKWLLTVKAEDYGC